eukprot:TRINITY_DN2787_c0_g2_i1.p1 TRINITY_DN2787_c0_g2~~TRINITY_DN2787_c0_g2_i1.p1  ORF type:complete len:627 (-),score=117.33 TRINITY_DN2787_c0_g2_i1:575-2416(-)
MESTGGGSGRWNSPPEFANCSPEEYASQIILFLSEYDWIFRDHLVNFLNNQLQNEMPKDWKNTLLALTPTEIQNIANLEENEMWPHDLKNFLHKCKILAMPRKLSENPLCFGNPLQKVKLDRIFTLGMNEKKIHEVEELASIVGELNKTSNVKLIVDVGAGKGYITQTLEHYFGMEVIGLEGQESRTHGASKRSILFQKELFLHEQRKLYKAKKASKRLDEFQPKPFFNMTFYINKPPDVNQFVGLIEPIKSKILEYQNSQSTKKGLEPVASKDEMEKMGLLSLHGCGDLSPSVLNLYVDCPQVKSMVCVGCCYSRIKEDPDDEIKYSDSFPMSLTIKNIFAKNSKFNKKLLKGILSVANESPNHFINLSQKELTNKSRLLWRSMLELILAKSFGYHRSHPVNIQNQKYKSDVNVPHQQSDVNVPHQQHSFPHDENCCSSHQHHTNEVPSNSQPPPNIPPKDQSPPSAIDSDQSIFPKEDNWTYTIRGLPIQSFECFESYCQNAIPSIRVIGKSGNWYLPQQFFGEEHYNAETEKSILKELQEVLYPQYQNLDLDLIAYLSLQNCLSGVCESLVMLDRFLYLEEQGNMSNYIIPVFLWETSPRNLAILSFKLN